MCGLFGWHLKPDALKFPEMKYLARELAEFNDLRGGDSWGFYGIKYGQAEYQVQKGLGKLFLHSGSLASYNLVMAHTRASSVGNISLDGAHPFTYGSIIGAHNGCVYNWKELNTRHKRNCIVDSQHIFMNLGEGKTLFDLEGSGVVTFVDVAENRHQVYLCNISGDLSFAGIGVHSKSEKVDTIHGLVWSSDRDHLEKSLNAVGVKWFFYQDQSDVTFRYGEVFKSTTKGLYQSSSTIAYKRNLYFSRSKSSYFSYMADRYPNMTPQSKRVGLAARWADEAVKRICAMALSGLAPGDTVESLKNKTAATAKKVVLKKAIKESGGQHMEIVPNTKKNALLTQALQDFEAGMSLLETIEDNTLTDREKLDWCLDKLAKLRKKTQELRQEAGNAVEDARFEYARGINALSMRYVRMTETLAHKARAFTNKLKAEDASWVCG